MANGGIIGPDNIPYISKNVTSFTSTTPGGHTFHPGTTAVDYIIAAGSGGRNGPGIGNSGSGAGGLTTSGDVGSFAEPVTPGGTSGAITIGAGGGDGASGSASSIASGGGIGPYSTVGGAQGVARGAGGITGGSGSGAAIQLQLQMVVESLLQDKEIQEDLEDPENHLVVVVDMVALVAHPEDTLHMDQDPVTQLQLQMTEQIPQIL